MPKSRKKSASRKPQFRYAHYNGRFYKIKNDGKGKLGKRISARAWGKALERYHARAKAYKSAARKPRRSIPPSRRYVGRTVKGYDYRVRNANALASLVPKLAPRFARSEKIVYCYLTAHVRIIGGEHDGFDFEMSTRSWVLSDAARDVEGTLLVDYKKLLDRIAEHQEIAGGSLAGDDFQVLSVKLSIRSLK